MLKIGSPQRLRSLTFVIPQALQGQTTGRQAAVETLRKTADALIAAEGELLTNQDEIQETVGEYDIYLFSQEPATQSPREVQILKRN